MTTAIGDESEIEASRAPLMDHLVELRGRLIVCIVALVISFFACFFISEQIYLLLLRPFVVAGAVLAEQKATHQGEGQPFDLLLTMLGLKALPHGAAIPKLNLIYTGALEIFFARIKLAMYGAVAISFPVLAFQIYRFVAPGLYKRERMAFLPFLIASPVLFLAGAALVYYIMLPFVLWFSLNQQIISPDIDVHLLPKVGEYLDLVAKLVLAFGLCFQLPVVLTLAGLSGLIEAKMLSSGRRYALLGIVVVSAIVTPPDMISPFLLAVPIYGLYEVSIWCVRLIELRRKRADDAEAAAG